MKSLTITLATRGRPELLVPTVKTTMKNVREPETKLVLAVDIDDFKTLAVRSQLSDSRIIWAIEPQPDYLGQKYNRGAKYAPADVYLTQVDYTPHVTEGFDTKILEAARIYPDGYAFIVNSLANLSFSQVHAATAPLVAKMGGIFPEYFPYWFVDHWFEELARRTGRLVYCDIKLDLTKRPGTQGNKEPYFWGTLFGCLEPVRARIADSIIDALDESPARKQALRANYPLHVEWSGTINELLRQDQGSPVDPTDERYAHVRARAMEIIKTRAPTWVPPEPLSIFVATPMISGTCYGAYTDSMMKLQKLCCERGVPLRLFPIFNQSHIDTARNVCADEFRKSGFSHFMFIDSDLSFQPESIFELAEADKDIVCGFYPKKRINWKKIVEAVKRGFADKDPEVLAHFVGDMVFTPALNDDSNRARTIYDLTLLHEGGTGFMMIKRNVFERVVGTVYEKTGPGSERMTSFFDAHVAQDGYTRHLTEDYAFCKLAREAGIEIWLAPWIKLIHHGYYQFIGNIEALAAVERPMEKAA